MTYATLLVHLDGAASNRAVLDAAASLARQFDAQVIGIAACQPVQIGACDGYMDGEIAVAEREIVTDELAQAKTEFYSHEGLQPHVLKWRSVPTLGRIAGLVAKEARCADLVITGIEPASGHLSTHADVGDLILLAGRPVLIVPDANATAEFRNVVVAWNDTRECRRAIMDALLILRRAERVTLVEVSQDPVTACDGIRDIVAWLRRHGVGADRINSRIHGSPVETLAGIAAEIGADLVVAGGYGHSRIREWAFGGVTRDLLLHERRCTLLSH